VVDRSSRLRGPAWVGEQPQTQAEPAVLQGAGDPVGAAREAAHWRGRTDQLQSQQAPRAHREPHQEHATGQDDHGGDDDE
jgi:hypothetical protein